MSEERISLPKVLLLSVFSLGAVFLFFGTIAALVPATNDVGVGFGVAGMIMMGTSGFAVSLISD